MREPMIIKNNRNLDLRSNLLEAGTIMIDTDFNPHMASIIIQQLLHLNSEGGEDPIQLYINSPGGCVASGLAIYDTIQTLSRDVETTAIGMAASMGAFILACGGKKGLRNITPNAQIMFHELSSGTSGRFSDMKVRMDHTAALDKRLNAILAKALGQDPKKLSKLLEKDVWLDGKEVIKFGAADSIIGVK